ncbi:MAG: hypothetical protein HKN36_02020 [Hellea sp.]|nr:hypothetical protein [Hellea sp.]
MTPIRLRHLTAILVLFPALLFATPAAAQDDNVLRSFEPDYFAHFAPRTALDMINRVPGFQLESGTTDRGIGQGGANLLLDGKLITGKGDDASEIIGRISAADIVRIDIVDGSSLNIPGLSGQVANIITQKDKSLNGTWAWNPEFRNRLEGNLFNGNVTISGESGDVSYSAELRNNARRVGQRGIETHTGLDGIVFQEFYEDLQSYSDSPGASVSLTYKPKEDHVGNLNIEYNLYDEDTRLKSTFEALTPRGEDGLFEYNFVEDEWNAKIDGDYEFPFAAGKLKLIAYHRTEHSPTFETIQRFNRQGGRLSETQFNQIADEAESIARAEYGWTPSEGRDWQFAAEGVFNFLDIESEFVDVLTPANSFTLDPARVEEWRGESTLTHTRTLSSKWDLQASIGAEYSELTYNDQARDFVRPKGFVALTYKPEDNLSIRGKFEREIGQLNFFDFIESIDLQDNLGQAANPNLKPSQSWIGEIEFNRRFDGGHAITARFFAEEVTNLVDRIPIGVSGDGIGNIDDASRFGVEIDGTIKGAPLGLKGMELNFNGFFIDSDVDDPVEGFSRRLNFYDYSYWEFDIRHDIPNTDLAYGFGAFQNHDTKVYRANAIEDFLFRGPWGSAFIEHKDIMGVKVNVSVQNLLDASNDFERVLYTDRRDIGSVDRIEYSKLEFDPFIRLSISGTF